MPNKSTSMIPAGYGEFMADIKQRVQAAQVKAALSANRELIALYWDIGKAIVDQQQSEGWGRSVVERLAADLQKEFPGLRGFSGSNIWRMRSFYLAYAKDVTNLAQAAREMEGSNLPQAVTQIPWFHNVALVEKLKDP